MHAALNSQTFPASLAEDCENYFYKFFPVINKIEPFKLL